jgi:phosphohistidine swiveling domain-containing protein
VPPPAPTDGDGTAARARFAAARQVRLDVEARARAALGADPARLARFERALAEAQRFDRVREEQAREFTLAWPVMRAAVLRLGDSLAAARRIEAPDDVHFLRRDEVARALDGDTPDLRLLVHERRAAWERQRGLVPPLLLGTVPPMLARILDDDLSAIRGPLDDAAALVGVPASGGFAVGAARVVRGPDEFDRVQPGDVLVASMTTPAWMPLFDRVVAVVTDNGGVGAHASIVAREYGIPAVVGLGDVTARLRDGEPIEVDGGAGTVRRLATD